MRKQAWESLCDDFGHLTRKTTLQNLGYPFRDALLETIHPTLKADQASVDRFKFFANDNPDRLSESV